MIFLFKQVNFQVPCSFSGVYSKMFVHHPITSTTTGIVPPLLKILLRPPFAATSSFDAQLLLTKVLGSGHAVDGSEIRRSPVEVGSFSHLFT